MRMEVDLQQYLGHASLTGNPELLPGDTIFVPRQGRGIAGVGWLGLLGVVGTVLGLYVAFANLDQAQMCKVGMLFAKKGLDQARVDRDFSGRTAHLRRRLGRACAHDQPSR